MAGRTNRFKWAEPGSMLDVDFIRNIAVRAERPVGTRDVIGFVRASGATDLMPMDLWRPYQVYGPTEMRITHRHGLILEDTKVNYLLHSREPRSQNVFLKRGVYSLQAWGPGYASVGIRGAVGAPVKFTQKEDGIVHVEIRDVWAAQLEEGEPSSFIPTGDRPARRAADVARFLIAHKGPGRFRVTYRGKGPALFGGNVELSGGESEVTYDAIDRHIISLGNKNDDVFLNGSVQRLTWWPDHA